VDLQVENFIKSLQVRNLHIKLTKKAIEYLSEVGYDPIFGARPLKRAIERHLADPLAKEILSGRFAEGSEISVTAASNGEGLVFTTHEHATAKK